eukprot:356154-Prymnesium_polylepis.1
MTWLRGPRPRPSTASPRRRSLKPPLYSRSLTSQLPVHLQLNQRTAAFPCTPRRGASSPRPAGPGP